MNNSPDPETAAPNSPRPFALSAAQRSLWFTQQAALDVPINVAQYVEIDGPIDAELFVRATSEVVQRAQFTQLRFVDTDDGLVGVYDPGLHYWADIIDLRDRPDPRAVAEEMMAQDYSRPLDPRVDRTARGCLFRLSDDKSLVYNRGHHLLSDGMGGKDRMVEALAAYHAAVTGEPAPPQKPVDLDLPARADAEYRGSKRFGTDRAYWRENMAGVGIAATLAHRPGRPTAVARRVASAVPLATMARLREAAHRGSTMLPNVLVAAFAAYLGRAAAQGDEVIFQFPVAARTTAALRATPLPVANIVPLRTGVTGAGTVADALQTTQAALMGALRHQRYRGEDIWADVAGDESSGATPRTAAQERSGPMLNLMLFEREFPCGQARATFHILTVGPADDLTINIYPVPGEDQDSSLMIGVEANPNRYDDAEVAEHHAQFLSMLDTFADAFLHAPDTRVDDLPLRFPEDGSYRVSSEGEVLGQAPGTVWDAVSDVAARRRHEPAVEFPGTSSPALLTFEQLHARARRLGAQLRALGARPGATVAIAVASDADRLLAWWAVAASGAAALLLDPSAPQSIPDAISESAGSVLVIGDDDAYPPAGVRAGDVHTLAGLAGVEPAAGYPAPRPDDTACFVIGAAGVAAMTQRAVAGLIADGVFASAASDPGYGRLSCTAPKASWAAHLEIVACAAHGLRLADADADLATHGIVPSAILADGVPGNATTVLVVDSGTAPAPTVRHAFGRDLRSTYAPGGMLGPFTATERIRPDQPIDRPLPSGRPRPGVDVAILDHRLRPLPPGITGDVYVVGSGAPQYFAGDPARTATMIVACPWQPGRRMVAAGDKGHREPGTGDLVIDHRSGDVVEIDGVRVDLALLERAATEVPGVAAATAAVLDDGVGIALRLAQTGPGVTGTAESRDPQRVRAAVRRRVNAELPAVQWLRRVAVLDSVPLDRNGVVDRSAAAPLIAAVPEPRAAQRRPSTPIEIAVADAVTDVLGVPDPSMDDELVQLGATSLGFMQLATYLGDTLRVVVSVRDLGDVTTLAELAAVLEASAPRRIGPGESPGTPGADGYRPTRAQQEIWLLNRADMHATVYHLPVRLVLAENIAADVVRAALVDVAARHEALRTVYPDADGEPVAVVRAVDEARVAAPISAATLDAAGVELAVSAPFDLTVDLPWRAIVDETGGRTELVLVAHHIAIDEWSLHIVVDDFAHALRARLDGAEPIWAEDAVGFGAVLEARPHVTDPAAEVHWAKVMREAPARIALPEPARTLPAGLTSGPATILRRTIGLAARESAATRARDAGTTLNTLLCVALSATVAEYTDSDDLVMSVPVAGRFTTEELRPVGMFVETVPVRTTGVRHSGVAEALARVGADLTAAITHADAAPTGLADVIFAYHASRPDLPGAAVFADVETLPSGQARTALEFTVFEEPDGLSVVLTVAGGRVDTVVAEHLLDRFVETVVAIGIAPPESVVARCVPAPADRARPDRAARRTTPVDPIDALRRRAETRPEATAVIAGDTTLTYQELLDRAETVANRLRENGVRPGDRVALILPRSADTVIAIVAVLMADAVYVPIEPGDPPSRTELIVAATAPAAFIETGVEVRPAAEEVRAQPVPGGAYVIHTSGSTGAPKAVMVTRTNLAAMLGAALDTIAATDHDVWSWVHSYAFDFSVWEILGPLASGGSVVVLERETVLDPRLLGPAMDRYGVTVCSQTPTAFGNLIDPAVSATVPHSRPTALRTVIFGGEPLSPALLRNWAAAHPEVALVNMYGITETTVHLTATEVDVDDDRSDIGVPLDGVAMTILGRDLRPVPIGAVGELYVSGDQVTLGYHNAPGTTASRFVADPSGTGRRMYRTGDRVREIAGGRMVYLDRTDDQVQIRGHRIELGEIVSALRDVPGVGDARVLVDPGNRNGDERLLAFVTEDGLADFDVLDALNEEQILGFCANILPGHMVPARVAIVDGWPMTPTGKLDRRRLTGMLPVAAARSSRALTPVEQSIADAMRAVIGTDADVAADANFFAAGGTSLSAARLAAALAGAGNHVTVADVFAHPTVAALAAHLETAAQTGRAVDGVRSGLAAFVTPVAGADLPLTPEQMDLWLRWRTQPDFTGYLMPLALPVDARPDALRRALVEIVTRHDALCTVFPVGVDGPVQHRLRDEDVLDVLEAQLATTVPVADDESLAATLGALHAPIDLAAELPWRVRIGEMAGQTWLLVVAHHIAVDGESFPILFAELESALAGTLPAAGGVDYREYSARRAGTLAARRNELVAHWVSAFDRAVEPLRLPELDPGATHPSSPDQTVVHRALRTLDRTETEVLDGLAVTRQSTPFIVVHTALAAVLARQAGTDVVTIGTALSGRIDPQLLDVPGLFARAVPLHTPIDLDLRFVDLLAAVTAVDLGAFAHADLPLTEITEIADPERVKAGTPLFEVSFGSVPDELVAVSPSGFEVISPGVISSEDSASGGIPFGGVPLFGVDVSMFRRDGALHLTMACTGAVASAARLDALCDLVVETIRRGVREPLSPVAELLAPARSAPSLPDLDAQNASRGPETLDELLTAGLVGDPEAIAIVDRRHRVPGSGSALTNAELDRLATLAARALIDSGIGPGDVVVAQLPRSSFGVIATTAVARAGAAFVNVDPADPAGRRQMIIERCRPRAVLTLAVTAESVPASVPVLVLDELLSDAVDSGTDSSGPAPFDTAERVRPLSVDDVAYITFTSGTTGLPKGVQVTHRGLSGWARDTVARLRLDVSDRVLHTYATGFDAHLMGLVPPRVAGAAIVVCPPDVIAADELAEFVDAERVSVLLTTPSVLATLSPDELPGVRHVAVGGEALGAGLVRDWTVEHTLSNEYGPTEATVAVSSARYGSAASGPVHIGVPLQGVGMYVLDHALRPVPDHTVGELYLAGNCLARGYLDDPAATARGFVADPRADGGRMYRTGDLVHRRPDGTFVIHGRTDDQVKIRGVRLEPGEVDAALSGLPGVATSVTATRTSPSGEKILVSWVVAEDGGQVADLPRQLAHLLPRSMIPSAFVPASALPIGRNGKVDVAALPDPDFAGTTGSPTARAGRPPSGVTEELVSTVWAEVLGRPVQSLDADSDFFAEGGTSLSATQVTSRLTAATGADIGVRVIFEARTLSGVARRVDDIRDTAGGSASEPSPARLPVPELLPLAYPQRRMWIHHHFDPRSTAYHVPVVLRIRGRVDLARLRKAVDEVVAAHAVLRTVYPDSPSGPRQRRIEHRSPVLRHRLVDAEAGPEGLRRQIDDFLRRPFDLESESGFRAAVFELDSAEDPHTHLAAVLHHIAIDGWSIRVLLTDLLRAYDGQRLSVPADEAFTYADFTQWQIARLGDPSDPHSRYARELRFWASTLAGAPGPLRLPGSVDLDGDDPDLHEAVRGGATGRLSTTIVGTDALHQTAKTLSASIFQVAHAGLATVLGQWTGEWDLLIGVPVHGRLAPEWESVVGMFVNTVALRTGLQPDLTIREAVERARDAALAAQPHSEVPYEDVARTVRPDGRAAGDPLISVLLVNQDVVPQSSGEVVLAGPSSNHPGTGADSVVATLIPEFTATVDAKFDIEVVLAERDDELHITVVHSAAVPADVARTLLDDFRRFVLAAAGDAEQPFPGATGPLTEASAAQRLPEMSNAGRSVSAPSVPPSRGASPTSLVVAITEVMSEVLEVTPGSVGDTDDFFTLGGTSLSATRVTSALGRRLGVRVPTRLLFENPTPVALAQAVSDLPDEESARAASASVPMDATVSHRTDTAVPETDLGDLPLAPTQRRMWVGAQMLGAVPIYAVPVVVPIPAGTDEPAVSTAVETLVDRHPALRTRYLATPDGPRQRVLGAWRPPLQRVSTTELATAAGIGMLGEPFDLTGEPPVRVWLVTGDDQLTPVAVVMIAHHIAMDGESAAIVQRELGLLLAGLELGPAPTGFATVARQMVADEERSRADLLDFWRRALEGHSGELDLAQRRPAVRDLRTSTIEYPLAGDVGQAVSSAARRAQASEFHILHAAMVLALAVQSGSDDIALATPASMRRDSGTAGTVGMLISTVVLRTRVVPGMTVGELIARVRDEDLAALDHAAIAFDDVVALIDPPRVPGRHPLVQVAFSLADPAGAPEPPMSDSAPADADSAEAWTLPRSEFDIHVVAVPDAGGWRLRVDHGRELFEESAIRALGERLVAAVAAVVGEPARRLASIEPLTGAERRFVASRARSSSVTGAEPLLAELLTEAVATFPDRPAIADESRSLTYRELDGWVSVTARALRQRGLGAGDAVAVVVPRSIESVVAIWAVSRIGGVCVPVDVTYPAARIDHVVAGAGASVLTPADIPGRPTEPVVSEPVTPVSPDALAYIITTSGTTGTPNVVGVTHRGVHRVASLGDVEPTDRVGMAISPGFDATFHDMLLPLAAGATLVVVPAGIAGGDDLTRFLDDTRVSVFTATPSVIRTLRPAAIGALRLVYIGGEALSADLATTWSEHAQVLNIYGPTETTVTVSTSAHRRGDPIRLGHPRPGIGAEVLDAQLRHVPPGVVGELYIGGTGVARGYLGDPALTAANFVAGPGGGRRYRTGDLVRWDRDTGELVYVGRADRQVKIRGQRVEPAEIDAVLVRAGAERSATVLRQGPVGPALVSYVVSPSVPVAELQAVCRSSLPRHMVPSRIVALDDLPLSGAGKIDTRRLPEPIWSESRRDPENDTEAAVLEAFRTVLGQPALGRDAAGLDAADGGAGIHVGMDDDFFAAGGHSLALLQLRDELAARTGRILDAADLFSHRTPAEVARLVDGPAGVELPAQRVVSLSPDSSARRPEVWCVHTAAGIVEPFRVLGDSLRSASVFGLQLPELVLPGRELPPTVEGIAELHVEAIRATQPQGPYRLVGWSVGGVIAHEIARRLVELGEEVALLVLLDPRTPAELGTVDDEELRAADHPLRELAERHDPEAVRRFEGRTRSLAAAARSYDLRPVDVGKVVYVAAQDNPDPENWVRVVDPGGVGVVDVMPAAATHAQLGQSEVMARVARRIEEEW
ncbi:Non-ribosomal peptide synthetase modules-related protein [Gordonia terrae C-6]|uniref:Non-ribosomal peptide synthetase modules-related protein n=1 Tax=Gordonia terrae C-6 TaxID=1316928 RepID=R7YB49_9ACTN|nr:non-ribosomal peptide synthetase [Gordonia terrae]EON33245.1 Non-ribosomal peptide synthetase modules-related protein [Gordonia terrae C-6]